MAVHQRICHLCQTVYTMPLASAQLLTELHLTAVGSHSVTYHMSTPCLNPSETGDGRS